MDTLLLKLRSKENLLLRNVACLVFAQKNWEQGNCRQKSQFYLFLPKELITQQNSLSKIEAIKGYLTNFKFSSANIYYLMRIRKGNNRQALFNESFLNYLQRLAPPDQLTVFLKGGKLFSNEPFLFLVTPSIQGYLLETLFLQIVYNDIPSNNIFSKIWHDLR